MFFNKSYPDSSSSPYLPTVSTSNTIWIWPAAYRFCFRSTGDEFFYPKMSKHCYKFIDTDMEAVNDLWLYLLKFGSVASILLKQLFLKSVMI